MTAVEAPPAAPRHESDLELEPGSAVRHRWSESDRYVPRAFVQPMQRFMRTEAAGGIVLLVAAVVALVWANSPWSESYERLWSTRVVVELGDLVHLDHLDLRAWVNDALMTVFFFVAGLEIKRELVQGDLRDRRAAALPAIAALGGMVVPALIFAALTAGSAGADGWGIPMATDIAFAVGVLSLLGDRVPSGAKIFLLTLAIADDIGAIVVIALFYTDGLSFGWLLAALAGLAVVATLRRGDVRSLAPYLAAGAWVWLALLESGVHATLAGVALGLMTPAWSFHDPARFAARARPLVDQVDAAYADGVLTVDELERDEAALEELTRLAVETRSPLERLATRLSPWSAFAIVPVFALANAGVRLDAEALAGAAGDRVAIGVALGLVAGKTIGVATATWLAVRLGIGRLPTATTWRHVVGLAITAGIGFTVALFVTGLAFDDPAATDAAKIGILAASSLAGVLGYLWLRAAPRPGPRVAR